MVSPRFVHDCEECVFLGTVEYSGELTYPNPDPATGGKLVKFVEPLKAHTFDLYFCESQPTGRTVIARYSDAGPDYKSGLPLAHSDSELRLAKNLAKERGLLK